MNQTFTKRFSSWNPYEIAMGEILQKKKIKLQPPWTKEVWIKIWTTGGLSQSWLTELNKKDLWQVVLLINWPPVSDKIKKDSIYGVFLITIFSVPLLSWITLIGDSHYLTYSMLNLRSWDRLMKASQVSRANGTSHTHQSTRIEVGFLHLYGS